MNWSVLHERSGALEDVLVEMRVDRVLGDDAEGDKAPEGAHVPGRKCLACSGDVTHHMSI